MADGRGQSEKQVIIECDGGRLYGMLHCPGEDPRGAIVFCNPLFEERKSSHRTMVEAARALCADGFLVLRFDYRGCGDSSGSFHDFSPTDWLVDIKLAVSFLTQHTPKVPVGLLGLRIGGALALKAVLNDSTVNCLVLWEPVVKGRDYFEQELRKKLMKEMVTFGRSRVTREELIKELEAGGQIDFDGYAVSSKLYREVSEIDLLESAANCRKPSLLVHVSHQDQPFDKAQGRHSSSIASLRDAFMPAHCRVELKIVKVQPFWNLIGYVDCSPLTSETSEWLRSRKETEKTKSFEQKETK